MISLRPPEDVRELRPRLQAMVAVALLAFLGLVGRLCQLQILEGDHYARRAERNFIDVVPVEAPRGRIFARGGEGLATNRPSYTLYLTAWTREVTDLGEGAHVTMGERVPIGREAVADIATLLDFVDEADKDEFFAEVDALRDDEKEGRYATAVRSNLSWEEYARIQARLDQLGPWIEIRESSRRFYPEGRVTGFVSGHMGSISPRLLERATHAGYRVGDRVGQTGVERQWENYLRGRLGARSRVVDARGREIADPPRHAVAALPPDRDPIPGQDIHLTLDLALQRLAYDTFQDKLAGALVALEVDTGAVLAMVSVPTIDPNRYEQSIPRDEWEAWVASPLKPFIDKTVQEHFFPGSTYKVVSAIAALQDPAFNPDREVECEGSVMYGGRRFRDTHRHGPMNLERGIIESCNVYFYTLAMEETLSLERVAKVAHALGLGERTGLGLNGEVKGRIPTEEFEARTGTYQRGVRLNSAIGQGNVKVTVLQIASVYATLANGGRLMTPYIVDRVMTNDGRVVFSNEPQPKGSPDLDPAVLARIHRGLVGVVNDERGTAFSERLPNIVVAGKTGTAQVGREAALEGIDIEGWDTSKDHAWFAAYAPADDPKIVVVALVEHGGAGADAAAPIVMKVIRQYLGETEGGDSRPRGPGVAPPLPGAHTVPAGGEAP